MHYKSMFPDFDYELVIPDGYFDSSWKDDVSPSIRKDIHHDLGVKIYCDYADRNRREMRQDTQFCVNLEDDQGLTTKGWFDSFEDALLFANALAQSLTTKGHDEMTYIHHVFTENTGGGVMVDYVCLKNGKVIGISDECLVLFDSYDDACEDDGTLNKGVIRFNKDYVYQGKE